MHGVAAILVSKRMAVDVRIAEHAQRGVRASLRRVLRVVIALNLHCLLYAVAKRCYRVHALVVCRQRTLPDQLP